MAAPGKSHRASHLVSVALAAGLAILAVASEGRFAQGFNLFACLAALCAFAAAARLGWPVPCMVIGILCGILYDAGPKGGTLEAQAWETVVTVFFCASAGLGVGLLLSARSRFYWAPPTRAVPDDAGTSR